MGPAQSAIEQFLAQRRIAVAGVSRQGNQPANAIFRMLRGAGCEVFPALHRLDSGGLGEDLASHQGAQRGDLIAGGAEDAG